MKYTLRLTGLSSRKDDFVFRFNDRDVGRTYADDTPQGPRWYWSIYGINVRGPLPEGVVMQGLAADRRVRKRHSEELESRVRLIRPDAIPPALLRCHIW